MTKTRIGPGILTFLAALAAQRAAAAPPSLEAFAGAVGGVASGVEVPGTCSTYGAPALEAAFFPSSLAMSVPQGAIAFCGYGGDIGSTAAVTGPVLASRSLSAVQLGHPCCSGTWAGSAEATADYKVLRAVARGTVTLPGSGSPVSLNGSSGAAIFDDWLTATSPSVANASAGFVRYTFAFDGSATTPGPAVSGVQKFAGATLHIEHDGGPNFEIVRVNAEGGASGTLHSRDGTSGMFVTGPGLVSGSGDFTSRQIGQFGETIDLSFTWGTPFRLKAGLMATVIGDGEASFGSTAQLTRIDFFDAGHAPIVDVTITSASGTVYGPPATTPPDAPPDAAPAAADAPGPGAIDASPGGMHTGPSSGGCSHAPAGGGGTAIAALSLLVVLVHRRHR